MKNDVRLKLIKAKRDKQAKQRSERNQTLAKSDYTEVIKSLEKLVDIVGEKPNVDGYVERILSKLDNIDSLAGELKNFRTLLIEVVDKKVGNIPKNIDVNNFGSVIKAIEKSKTKLPDWLSKDVTIGLGETLKQILEKIENQTVKQDPSDFIPIRRVKMLGNSRLVFDDSTWTGSAAGGGGGIQDALISGNAVRVTGTIAIDTTGLATSTKQDTIIGHLDGVEGLLGTIDVDTGNIATSVASIDTDTTTIIGHLDGVEALLTTIDTDTGAIATSIASVDTKTPALGQALAAASVPVVLTAAQITTLTPPAAITGYATSAKQDTIIGHVDGIETVLGTIDADTGNISTKIDTLAGAVSGAEMQVDIVTSALPSGASTLAEQQSQTTHLATIAGDTTDIEAAVELLDDAVYVDDADWTDNTSKHLLVGGVYQSSPHTVTDGDVSPFLTDVNGRLVVAATDNGGSLTVDNAGLTELAAAINASSQMDVNIAANGIGLATSAKQDTIIGHVDGLEGLLTTIDADTGTILTSNAAIQTSVELIDDTVKVLGTDTYTEATSKGIVIGGVRRDADTTLANTTNEFAPFQLDANGYLKVEIFDGGGSHTVDNNGTFVAQIDGAALTALQLIDDTVFADDGNGFTLGTSKVNAIGYIADETSTDSVDEGDIGIPRMTLDRKQIATIQPGTANGLSVMNATSSDGGTALTNSAQVIKASAGQVYGWFIYNPNATAQFVQFYNTAAASVTVGTTNPLFMLTIPATSAANVEFTNGISFTNAGFSWAATSTAGGNGAPGTALDANAFYK